MNQLEFDFGIAAFSEYDADGHLGVSIDHAGAKAGVPPAEVITPYGFVSRPLDPEVDADAFPSHGCTVLWGRAGDGFFVLPVQDPRVTPTLPRVRKGGSMFYCASGSYALWDGVDPAGVTNPGSFTLAAKYGSKSHVIALSVRRDGSESVQVLHGEGHGLALTAGGDRSALLRNADGNAYYETNDDGNVIAGKTKVQGSLTVGEQAAAEPAALASAVIAALQLLEAAMVKGNAGGPLLPAPVLQPILAKLPAKCLKST